MKKNIIRLTSEFPFHCPHAGSAPETLCCSVPESHIAPQIFWWSRWRPRWLCASSAVPVVGLWLTNEPLGDRRFFPLGFIWKMSPPIFQVELYWTKIEMQHLVLLPFSMRWTAKAACRQRAFVVKQQRLKMNPGALAGPYNKFIFNWSHTCEVRVYSSYRVSYSRLFSWYCSW